MTAHAEQQTLSSAASGVPPQEVCRSVEARARKRFFGTRDGTQESDRGHLKGPDLELTLMVSTLASICTLYGSEEIDTPAKKAPNSAVPTHKHPVRQTGAG